MVVRRCLAVARVSCRACYASCHRKMGNVSFSGMRRFISNEALVGFYRFWQELSSPDIVGINSAKVKNCSGKYVAESDYVIHIPVLLPSKRGEHSNGARRPGLQAHTLAMEASVRLWRAALLFCLREAAMPCNRRILSRVARQRQRCYRPHSHRGAFPATRLCVAVELLLQAAKKSRLSKVPARRGHVLRLRAGDSPASYALMPPVNNG